MGWGNRKGPAGRSQPGQQAEPKQRSSLEESCLSLRCDWPSVGNGELSRQIGPKLLKGHPKSGGLGNGDAVERISDADLLGLAPVLNHLVAATGCRRNAAKAKNGNRTLKGV